MWRRILQGLGKAVGGDLHPLPRTPDLARFPDLPTVGHDPAEMERLRKLCETLENPQYRRLQAARKAKG